MDAEEDDPFVGIKKTISVAKNTPAVVTVPGTGGDLHDEHPLSAVRIRAAAQAGRDLGREGRLALMRTIGARFGVPPEGFPTGQSRIYVDGDIRFEGLLRRLSKSGSSRAASANLKRTAQLVEINIWLVLTTTAREYDPAVTARSSEREDSFRWGGLDFLDTVKNHLGLPKSIVVNWITVDPYESEETHNLVHPSKIPVRDQMLGYAAVTRYNFEKFQEHVEKAIGDAQGQSLFAALGKDAKMVWQAYSFLAPGGTPFDPKEGPHHGQRFGVKSALGYLKHLANDAGVALDLNAILSTTSLHRTDYIKIAKARAMEAAFFESLLEKEAVAAGVSTAPQ